MKNENLLIGLALVGGYLYFNQTPKENYFFVPGVGDVPESKLPDYGYVKYNGKWFKYTDLQAAAAANGVNTGNIDITTQQGIDLFMTLLSAGLGIATTVINNTQAQKDDLIEQILTKYTLPVSSSYMANFPYTEVKLRTFTVAKLNQVLGGNMAVTGVLDRADREHSTQCNNGRYTNKNGSGACSHNTGVRQTGRRAALIDDL